MIFDRLRNWGRPAKDPVSFLLESAQPDASLDLRVDWLERCFRWIQSTAHVAGTDSSQSASPHVRLRFLLQVLDRNPGWKQNVGRTLATLARDTYAFRLFARSGLGRERGFVSEAVERALRAVLPRPREENDLADVLHRVFDGEKDVSWVESLTPETIERLVALVRDSGGVAGGTVDRWREELLAATKALAARIATLGTSLEILTRISPDCRENPYLALTTDVPVEAYRRVIEDCRVATQALYDELETSGASVSLVYTLDTMQSGLERVRSLIEVQEAKPADRPLVFRDFAAKLARQSLDQRDLFSLFRSNVRLVAKKITERTGASGEHYIARNRREYLSMIRAGLGGGVIMVFATLNKLQIHRLHLPLFPEFLFFSLNYVTSFLFLQRMGFTLATKQPSATAAALAGKLESLQEEGEIRAFVDEACRMARTQVAALLGNLFLLIPTAMAVSWVFPRLFGKELLSGVAANGVLESLHPLRSFTLINSALTGVLLWISSLTAGWLENSLVYRQVPLALATHPRLRRAIGAERAQALGEALVRNATWVGGNVSLGVMMGAVSIGGVFFGLPFDVRHVTLAAASLTFAGTKLVALGMPWTDLIAPSIGVLGIGMLNFAVAYALAFLVAARSRDLSLGSERRLIRALRTRLRHRPLDFLLPRERESEKAG